MPNSLSILAVHGVGHEENDPQFQTSWRDAMTADIRAWNNDVAIDVEFLAFDDLFDHAPLNPVVYAEAMAKLLYSGIVHGVGDLFTRERALFQIPDRIRWTAGMVAQWASEDDLRTAVRKAVLDRLAAGNFTTVFAHSLGSLVCYDTFRREPGAIAGKTLVTLGSQIGNPAVREIFAGRIEPLEPAKMWYHLYNPDDHVMTAPIRLNRDNFVQIGTEFDIANDPLNHNAVWYLDHANTRARVWRDLATARMERSLARSLQTFKALSRKPQRRALLVGINDYPDPANRLEGCVNDVFLMSSVLQECGFDAEDIRVVLNERATAGNFFERLHWLLDDVAAGDERVLFYSGHGAQMPAYGNRDEVDHFDECLVPWDFDWTPGRAVTDKQFFELYTQLPYESYFAAIFDCCHSGGMTRDGVRKARGISPPDDVRHRALRWNAKLQMWEERALSPEKPLTAGQKSPAFAGADRNTFRLGRGMALRTLEKKRYDKTRQALRHDGPYLPIIIEACREQELSFEYRHGAASYGAFTYSLAQVLRENRAKNKNLTFTQLKERVALRLKALKYEQTPCLIGPTAIVGGEIPWMQGKPSRRSKRA